MLVRYQKIHTKIWQDEKFILLTDDARYLFLYLMTSPHSNAIGIYVLPKKYIEGDLDWDAKQLREPFTELLQKGLIYYDEKVSLLVITNHLKYNPLENGNQVKYAVNQIAALPKSEIISNILELLTKPFHKPLRELLEQGYANPVTVTVTYTDKDIVKDDTLKGEPEKPLKEVFGQFKNVKLSPDEFKKLVDKFGATGTDARIENLSEYIASKKAKYDSHYATILSWERRNGKDEKKVGVKDDDATKAWLTVMQGITSNTPIEDERAKKALEAIGGRGVIRNASSRDIGFIQKNFEKNYNAA